MRLVLPFLLFCNVVATRVAAQMPVIPVIPVEKEPHHKTVFENETVKILDLRIAAGDSTLLHTHSAASVVVFLTKSALVIQNAGEAAVVTQVKPGDVVYRAYDVKPLAHRVWTQDSVAFHCLVIEVKRGGH
jgi:hypothetical protein